MKVGTIFNDTSRVFLIQEFNDNKLVLLNLKDFTTRTLEGAENIEWIKGYADRTKFNELFFIYLDILTDSHPYVIQDLSGNIALSKIPYTEYSKISYEIESYEERVKFWEENIRVIASKEVKEDIPGVLKLPEIYVEYFNLLHLWMNSTPLYTNNLSSIIYALKMMPNFDEYTK
jgi:hypothetical protein